VAPLSAFNETLVEDPRVNRLEDTFMLWKTICSSKLLSKVQIVRPARPIDWDTTSPAEHPRFSSWTKPTFFERSLMLVSRLSTTFPNSATRAMTTRLLQRVRAVFSLGPHKTQSNGAISSQGSKNSSSGYTARIRHPDGSSWPTSPPLS